MSNQTLFNDALRTTVDLERYVTSEKNRIKRLLNEARKEVVADLVKIDPTSPKLAKFRQARLLQLEKDISGILDSTYKDIVNSNAKNLNEISAISANTAVKQIRDAIGVEVIKVTLDQDQLKSIARNTLLQGRFLKDWWSKAKDDTRKRLGSGINEVMQALQIGQIKGDSLAQLIKRVKGTAIDPGIWKATIRDANALIHTSTMQVAHEARQSVFKQHEKVLKGFVVVATLDQKTTPLCRSLDGRVYDMNFEPIDHNVPLPVGGTPPYHFNCRTVLAPYTKTYNELIAETGDLTRRQRRTLQQLPDEKRAAMGGPVDGDMTYNKWLKSQKESVQIEVLGPTRQRLWKENKLSMSDLVHQNGRPLTIDQLKNKIFKKGFKSIGDPLPLYGTKPTTPTIKKTTKKTPPKTPTTPIKPTTPKTTITPKSTTKPKPKVVSKKTPTKKIKPVTPAEQIKNEIEESKKLGEKALKDFVPATTHKEANEFLRRYIPKADYFKLPLEYCNEINKTIAQLAAENKGIMFDQLKMVKKKSERMLMYNEQVWDTKLGRYKSILGINKAQIDRYGNLEYLQRSLSNSSEMKFSIPSNLKEVVVHEYGHHLTVVNVVTKLRSRDIETLLKYIITEKEGYELGSKYATSKIEEGIAEIYTKWFKGEKLKKKWVDAFNDASDIIKITEQR